jgi:hypothetical protein
VGLFSFIGACNLHASLGNTTMMIRYNQ